MQDWQLIELIVTTIADRYQVNWKRVVNPKTYEQVILQRMAVGKLANYIPADFVAQQFGLTIEEVKSHITVYGCLYDSYKNVQELCDFITRKILYKIKAAA